MNNFRSADKLMLQHFRERDVYAYAIQKSYAMQRHRSVQHPIVNKSICVPVFVLILS